jgi:hypothetical protein
MKVEVNTEIQHDINISFPLQDPSMLSPLARKYQKRRKNPINVS